MATNDRVTSSDYEFVDLSEDDKVAAQKYLSENGVRGLEGFLAERLEIWRKWFVSFCCLSIDRNDQSFLLVL